MTTYNTIDEVATVTDPRGIATSFLYDGLGRRTQTIEAVNTPDQRTTSVAYDRSDDVVSQTDGRGIVTDYQYDALNRRTQMTAAANSSLAQSTETVYDAADNVLSITDAKGNQTTFTYNARNERTSETDAANDPSVARRTDFAYNANSQVTLVTAGQASDTDYQHIVVTQYGYDELGRRTTVTEGTGTDQRTTTTVYDKNNNVKTVIDPRNTFTGYQYDALNRLTQVREASGDALNERTTTYAYDRGSNVTSMTTGQSPNGFLYNHPETTNYDYDTLGRRTQTTEAAGTTDKRITQTAYDADNNVVSQIDGRGITTRFGYDDLNRRTAVFAANSIPSNVVPTVPTVTEVTYDADNNVISVNDPRGLITQYEYDKLNRQTSMTEATGTPLARETDYAYDAAGNRTSMTTGLSGTNPHVVTTLYDYDALNRRTKTVEAEDTGDERTTEMVYDAASNLVSITTGEAVGILNYDHRETTTMAYDSLNRKTSVTDPLARVTGTVYDKDNNVIQVIAPADNTDPNNPLAPAVTTYTYDVLNRLTQTEDPKGNITTNKYDATENLVRVTNSVTQKVTYTYDFLNRRTSTVDTHGDTTTQVYDGDNNVVKVIDPDKLTSTFSFDALNRRVNATDVKGNTTRSSYDADGNLTSTTDRDGRTNSMTYDALNRLTNATWTGGTPDTLTYTYDAANNLLTASNSTGTVTRTYDDLNRVDTETDVWGVTLTYTYDAANNQDSVVDSKGGQTTATYDDANRLTSETLKAPGQATLREDIKYTDRDQILKEERFRNGTSVGTTQFTYDQVGQVTKMVLSNVIDGATNTINVTTYIYDVASRLTQMQNDSSYNPVKRDFGNNQSSSNFVNGIREVDPSPGDRQLLQAGFTSNTVLFEVGPGNQVLNDGTWKYEYNNEGTLKRKYQDGGEEWNYTYDNANRLLSISVFDKPNGTGQTEWTVVYQYDALGHLIGRTYSTFSGGTLDTTTVQHFVTDQMGNSSADLNGSNAVQTFYLRGTSQDMVFAAANVSGDRSGTGMWYLSDQLGTVQMVANAFGVVVDSYAYNSLGVVTAEAAPSLKDPYRYLGQFTDTATALVFANGQWSDPGLGRALRQDPLSFQTRDRQLQQFVSASTTGSSFAVWLNKNVLLQNLRGNYGLDALQYQVQSRSTKLGQLNTEATATQWAGVTVQNFAWGAFDALTMNLTQQARQGLAADLVDYSSTEYTLGSYTGTAVRWGIEIAAVVGTAGAGAGASGGFTSQIGAVLGKVGLGRKSLGLLGGLAGTAYGGLTGEGTWDSARALQGGISGALIGVGLGGLSSGAGFWTVTSSSAAISAGTSGLGVLRQGPDADVGQWAAATASGAASGFANAAVAYGVGAFGPSGWTGAILSGAAGGAVGSAVSLYTSRWLSEMGLGVAPRLTDQQMYASIAAAAVGGALGGALGHGLTGGLRYGEAAGEQLAGKIMSNQMTAWFSRNVIAGALGGLVGDALSQGAALGTGAQEQWSVEQSIEATVMGAVTGYASAAGQWSAFHACYAEGTLLDIPTGRKCIELFKEDDDILTRDEMDASAPLVTSKVVKVLRRLGRVWELRMQGTGPIRTTGEHPYYRQGDGWVACNVLQEGDLLHCRDGQWRRVAGVRDTGEITTVYNVTVERYHTYFVGGEDWGFSVWAHNSYTNISEEQAVQKLKNAGFTQEDAEVLAARGASQGVNGERWLSDVTAGTTRNNLSGEQRRMVAAELLNESVGGLAYRYPAQEGEHGVGTTSSPSSVPHTTKTLAEWLSGEAALLAEARSQFNANPEWQGINPDTTPVFYRPQAEVEAIRAKAGESGGHHPHGLALGGPEGQTLTVTNETKYDKNPAHSAATGLQQRLINVIKRELGI